ncbi:MAG: nucleotidyltransferase domain-containing protein [Undibacterium umbellatum]|jgi:predicted nucleotidyltransferase|uniref:nucleotidyltransferase domain-containing protein n=1 Tax=Undibacterium TaxID=401469 RepID=UPI0027304342|nr:nucleotidyltransferase domain-containing protein [Undibacterium sp.]MDP1978352.1 nucleotidyltransferase domain-containing protein [Undibacterium sp.]
MNTTTLPLEEQEHPIDPVIRAEINATLQRIEQMHDVKVLFACESGSRGWGFASPDSDYDVRFIYANKLDWYLTVFPGRDVIELPVNEIYDVSGWDVRKALGLLRNGNATLIEWLSSPVVYAADPVFLQALQAASREVHRPERAYYHYLHMASKNYREHLQGEMVKLKKYLYVLRPLLACLWIEQDLGPVPMRFQDMVDATIEDKELLASIAELLVIKRRAKESELSVPMPVINSFIESQLQRLDGVRTNSTGDMDFSVLDRLLLDTVMKKTA